MIRAVDGYEQSQACANDVQHEGNKQCLIGAFAHFVNVFCAQILRVVADHSRAECGQRRHCELQKFVCRSHAVLSRIAYDHKSVGKDVEFDGFGEHNDDAD